MNINAHEFSDIVISLGSFEPRPTKQCKLKRLIHNLKLKQADVNKTIKVIKN